MPDQTCGAEEARTRLPELLQRAHDGGITVITRHGTPYAALVPLDALPVARGSLLELRNSGAGLWGPDSQATLRELREEWP